jgi:bifunctional ADP-heptose synthase (sugar kinase/adenylyltransferase)
VPERQRAVVVAGLECVDAVVVFNEVRCLRFLRAVRPDIYVKGGDYTPDSLDPGERGVLDAVGSQIKILAFEPGFSTSELIRKMRAG